MSIFLPHGVLQQQTVGAAYDPGMMTYDGSTGFYRDDTLPTWSGNKITAVARFNTASFSGGSTKYIMNMAGSASNYSRIAILVFHNDHATADFRDKIRVLTMNSSGTIIYSDMSTNVVADGNDHTLFVSFDGDNGLSTFYIDGVDAADAGSALRVAATTGTLNTSGSGIAVVGSVDAVANNTWNNDIGFCGYREAYLTNPLDFMTVSGPKELDESGWTEWGAQPLYWNQFGTMDDNKGSAGNMAEVGMISGPA